MAQPDTEPTIGELLDRHGVSRRGFLKYCTAMASLLGLPPLAARAMAAQLRATHRPSVIYLSFQECTGCLESLTRSFSPTIENLIFNVVSLDYVDTLMAAAGAQAEQARAQAMEANYGKYLLVVDGALPTADDGVYHCAAGRTGIDILAAAPLAHSARMSMPVRPAAQWYTPSSAVGSAPSTTSRYFP